MKKVVTLITLLFVLSGLKSQTNINGVINDYAAVTGIDTAGCNNDFTVDDASAFAVGDTVLIIQMQGATIDQSNSAAFGDVVNYGSAGNFEKNVISAISGNVISFGFELANTYDANGSVQIVSIPYYNGNVTVSGGMLTADDWDGAKGGVLIFSASGDVTLNSHIDVTNKGFRGGDNVVVAAYSCNFLTQRTDYFYPEGTENAAKKGEGIAMFTLNGSHGRGKQANGGGAGNDHNSGGAGGSNSAAGGNGGRNEEPSFGCQGDFPGFGGVALDYSANRLFMGGGAGCGHGNNANYVAPDGAGIVIIKANSINKFTGNIIAKGTNGISISNDGGVGGSAGGAVFLEVNSWTSSLLVNIQGGNGGNTQNIGNRCYGPGGGGGAGVFISNMPTYPNQLFNTSGSSGVVTTSTNPCNGGTLGATDGGGLGEQHFNRSIPFSNIPLASGTPLSVGSLDTLEVCEGNDYVYNIAATPGQNYQWQIDSTGVWENLNVDLNYSNVDTNNGFTITDATLAMENYSFRLVVYNSCDSVASPRIYVEVNSNPTINTHPTSQTSCQNGNATFFAQVADAISYQWQQLVGGVWTNLNNNSNFSGVNNDTLQVSNIPLSFDGTLFRLVATNPCANRFSNPAFLNLSSNPITIDNVSDTTVICELADTFLFVSSASLVDSIHWQIDQGSGFVDLVNNTDYQGVNQDTLQLFSIALAQHLNEFRALLFNDCGESAISDTILLEVYDEPAISIQDSLDACEGNGIFITPTNVSGSNITYQWQIDSTGVWENLTNSGGYSNTTANFLVINGSIVSSQLNAFRYRVTINSDCGTAISDALYLNVLGTPTLNSLMLNDTLCLGDTALLFADVNFATTYQWQSNASGVFANLSNNAQFEGVNTDSLQINNVSIADTGVSFLLTMQNGICPSVNSPSVEIVLGGSIIQITSVADSFTYCTGFDSLFYVEYTGTVTQFQWQINSGGGFVDLINDANHTGVQNDTLSLINFGATQDNNTYRLLIQNDCGGVDTSDVFLVEFSNAGIQNYPANLSACEGDTVSFVQSSSIPAVSKQWQIYQNGAFVDLVNNAQYQGVNDDTLIITPVLLSMDQDSFNCVVVDSCGASNHAPNPIILTVHPIESDSLNISICQGDSFVLSDGTTITTSGQFADTIQNASLNGCDSIYYYTINVNPISVSSINVDLCQGDTLFTSNDTITLAGNYADTLINASALGCDSIVNYQVNFLAIPSSSIVDSFCAGSFYLLASGDTATLAGNYSDTLSNAAANSCDSIVNYQLSIINPLPITTINDTICYTEWLFLSNGDSVNVSGVYNDTLIAQNTCDSIIEYQLEVLPQNLILAQSTNQNVCEGDTVLFFVNSQNQDVSYQWFNNNIAMPLETNDTLIILNVSSTLNGNIFQVRIDAACDTLFSNAVNLIVRPEIQLQDSLSNDTICEGEDIQFSLTTNTPPANVEWYENGVLISSGTSLIFDILNASIALNGNSYQAVVTDSCNNLDSSNIVSVVVYPNIQLLNQSNDAAICNGEDVLFYVTASGQNLSYQWFENGNPLPLAINDTLLLTNLNQSVNGNSYQCVINSSCGSLNSNLMSIAVSDTTTISQQATDLTQCAGFSFTLFVDANDVIDYQWQMDTGFGYQNISDGPIGIVNAIASGTTNDTLTISNYDLNLSGTNFQVVLNTVCGLESPFEPIVVTITEPVVYTNEYNDTILCEHEITPLIFPYLPGDALWSNGNIGNALLPTETGEYTVSFIDTNACPNADTLNITIEDCLANCKVLLPTGFSPNASGTNDVLRAIYNCEVDFFAFEIYNRFGEKVFATQSILDAWDGYYNNKPAPLGVYTWYMEYQIKGIDKLEQTSGNITLIR